MTKFAGAIKIFPRAFDVLLISLEFSFLLPSVDIMLGVREGGTRYIEGSQKEERGRLKSVERRT